VEVHIESTEGCSAANVGKSVELIDKETPNPLQFQEKSIKTKVLNADK